MSPVACYAAAHRTVLKRDLDKLDVLFRRLMRQVVGPPGGIDWSSPWHDILHDWHRRVAGITSRIGIETWSAQCLRHHWRFAHYAANLPTSRWIMRAFHWRPEGQRPRGAPQHTWEHKLVAYCRWTGRVDWKTFAADSHAWYAEVDAFINFCVNV